MKEFPLRYFPVLCLFALLALGQAFAGTMTANGAAIKPHDAAQPNACADPPCVYTPTNAAPINNDPNSEVNVRNQANLAKTNAQAHPVRKSRVPEGGTFWFLLIGAVVFFFVRFIASRKKEG